MLQSSERFEINPQTVFNAFTEAEKEGLDFIGLFHSHPALATPSSIDIKYMRLWGKSLWLIFSLIDNSLATYQLEDGKVKAITTRIQ